MEVLFVHPNFPGQFRRFAAALAREPGMRVYGVGDAGWMTETVSLPDIPIIAYPKPKEVSKNTHPYARSFDSAVRRGQQIVQTLLTHKRQGLEPDFIIVHPGWGDAFYLKDIFPGATIIGLFEYYYRARGADVGFDPEFPMNFDDIFRVRSLNATQLLALESCDTGYCSTGSNGMSNTMASIPAQSHPTPMQPSRFRMDPFIAPEKKYSPTSAAALNLTGDFIFSCGLCRTFLQHALIVT